MSAPRVVMYTAIYCGYCRRARALLDQAGVAHEVKDITVDFAERRRIARETGHRTVPAIFLDGELLGGHDTLVELLRTGELARRLAAPPPA
ncbi:MAG: glutaredoxin [Kofleriaceae bacterium]|nr:glutaredoxin [Kofleriaceae bacterium]MCL4224331.1 glutaredoxin [Myxococcales bacterium]